ncbi:MAG: tripartite tricarboxylate transporter TctB family protein [Blautia sp.]|nr:tripartite tricarboxylate transporter TctB family protein [Blautia sp.]
MDEKSKKNRILGVISLGLSIWITYLSLNLKATGYEGDPGPSMFPLIGAVILAACGIAMIVAPGKKEGTFLTKEQWKAGGKMFCMYLLLALLLYLFGFLGAVPVMLFIITYMLSGLSLSDKTPKQRLITSLIFGIVGGIVLYLLYVKVLDAKMPEGIILKMLSK